MLAFLVGWGVFWLLLWSGVLAMGLVAKEDNWIGCGFIMACISSCYLIAVSIGALLS